MRTIIFDTETSGLPLPSVAEIHKQPRIIELGALLVDGPNVLDTLSQLINPGLGITIEPKITKITGITNDMLVDQPTFPAYLPKLKEFFTGATMLIAHNAPFDVGLMCFELKRAGCDDFPWPDEILCTQSEYQSRMGFNPHLIDLYEVIMGKPLEQKHRAIEDCRVVHEILIQDKFFEKMGVY